jgi:hypothetical protein
MNQKPIIVFLWIVLALVIIAFGVWYFLIANKQNTLDAELAGRGIESAIPTFGGGLGSLYENTAESFGSASTTVTRADSPKILAPKLWQLSAVPAAGVAAFSSTTASSTSLYFLERVSGNVFSADPATSAVIRVTQTLIPYTYRASWISTSTVIMEHIGDGGIVEHRIGTIVATSSAEQARLETIQVSGDVVGMYGNPDSAMILTVVNTQPGLLATVAPHNSNKTPKKVWKSLVEHLRFSWVGSDILVFQSAAQGLEGSAYRIDSATGKERLLVSGVAGLSIAAHRDGSIIFSESSQGSLQTTLRTTTKEFVLGIKTLGEKCVFTPDGTIAYCAVPQELPRLPYPDSWYRGETHTSDVWWQINIDTGVVTEFLSPEREFGVRIDVAEPYIDVRGQYVVFLDRASGTPWAMRVAQ